MPAQPIISEMWPRFLLPIIRKEWYQRMTSIQSTVLQFFDVQTSRTASEESQGIGDFGLVPEYNSPDALGAPAAIQFDQFNALYPKTFIHKEYAKGVAIERKLVDDDQRGLITRRARGLGTSFGTTLAVHAASVFNNAFSATQLGGDGQPLVADAHPNRPSDTTTTFDNKGTTPLDYAAVVATIQAGKRLKDDRGNPLPVVYRVLLVPTELEAKAYEITNAINKPGTADNDANFLGSQGLITVVDPYLTDSNNWFMIDPNMARDHLIWYWRVRPDLAIDPTSDFNLVAKYRGYMRFSYGFDDWRWIYGHEVAP
jgi:phage major head subunit gpT-like protein